MTKKRYNPPVFPFSALVGLDLLKLGLILNAVNPGLGGVLIHGEKGTAKSTAARSLARLLPEIEVIRGCPYRCDPSKPVLMCADCMTRLKSGKRLEGEKNTVQIVELPLNATEDRLAGSIDFEQALHTGKKHFQPGLLAEANRGIIYIDEVNLLQDHLVDILLDTAVTGINRVQREGISYIHPSRFILIATMNPEEGDIRPQILDRFGFAVNINGLSEPEERAEILRRCEQFDNDHKGFSEKWKDEQDSLRKSIINAKRLLKGVSITPEQIYEISVICSEHQAAGHRADILIEKTARTLAALDCRIKVRKSDIYRTLQLVMPHRIRNREELHKRSFGASIPEQEKESGRALTDAESPGKKPDSANRNGHPDTGDRPGIESQENPSSPDRKSADDNISRSGTAGENGGSDNTASPGTVFEIGNTLDIPEYELRFPRDNLRRRTGGRRIATITSNRTGRYVRSTSLRLNNDLAFDATLRAAAPYQKTRPHKNLAVNIKESDIREKVRQKKTSNLLLFIADASGSMGTKLMKETKSTILALLIEAYQKRDKVGMVSFREHDAEVILPPTNSISIAKKMLEDLPTGGKTPLGTGLLTGYQLIKVQLRQNPEVLPLAVVITDGRANIGLDKSKSYEGPRFSEVYREIYEICRLFRAENRVRTMVIDVEDKSIGSFERAKKLAKDLGAKYYVLEDIISQSILKTVKEVKEKTE